MNYEENLLGKALFVHVACAFSDCCHARLGQKPGEIEVFNDTFSNQMDCQAFCDYTSNVKSQLECRDLCPSEYVWFVIIIISFGINTC